MSSQKILQKVFFSPNISEIEMMILTHFKSKDSRNLSQQETLQLSLLLQLYIQSSTCPCLIHMMDGKVLAKLLLTTYYTYNHPRVASSRPRIININPPCKSVAPVFQFHHTFLFCFRLKTTQKIPHNFAFDTKLILKITFCIHARTLDFVALLNCFCPVSLLILSKQILDTQNLFLLS